MKKFMKALTVVFCAAILVAGSITATLAYLATKTDPVQNTFVAGDINITLTPASTNNDTMIPGMDIAKNPSVTVTAGSVDCWLFVKVTEENGFAKLSDAGKLIHKIRPGFDCREYGFKKLHQLLLAYPEKYQVIYYPTKTPAKLVAYRCCA